ncbi:MAG: hypothetical protein C00003105_01979 [ANME-2 cluster archaeon HR1]|nr:MAG: hypothetical protein C00003105_01979 [ANME-2 cluster archaeon HR1]
MALPPACLHIAIEPSEFAVSVISLSVVPPLGNVGLGSISGASRVSDKSVSRIALTRIFSSMLRSSLISPGFNSPTAILILFVGPVCWARCTTSALIALSYPVTCVPT